MAGRSEGPAAPQKRHLLVDTQGLVLHAIVHAADFQDRDGGALLMQTLFGLFPFLRKLYADAGYQGPAFRTAVRKTLRQVDVEISSDPIVPKASRCCRNAGSSNARSVGSIVAVV